MVLKRCYLFSLYIKYIKNKKEKTIKTHETTLKIVIFLIKIHKNIENITKKHMKINCSVELRRVSSSMKPRNAPPNLHSSTWLAYVLAASGKSGDWGAMDTGGVACGEVGIKTSGMRSRPHPSGSHVSITAHA